MTSFKEETVGVIVARFQVPELHEGHVWLINNVMKRHEDVIIFLGVHGGVRTKIDPLTFEERKIMIEQSFGSLLTILPIKDHPFSHELWSDNLDLLIREHKKGSAIIYGSRDSVADPKKEKHYTGIFPVQYLETPFTTSGTQARAKLEFPHTPDARAAIIWDQQHRHSYMYSTSDLAIRDPKNDLVLLTGKKAHSGKLAFMGGHSEKADDSAGNTALRERGEEIKGIKISDPILIDAVTINDPRYRGTEDGVMTNFFVSDYFGGDPVPSDDIDTVAWVHPDDFPDVLVPWHQKLGEIYKGRVYAPQRSSF